MTRVVDDRGLLDALSDTAAAADDTQRQHVRRPTHIQHLLLPVSGCGTIYRLTYDR